MKNEITIPETKPKARKEDVIKALVVVAREKHTAAALARKQEIEAATERYESLLKAFFLKNPSAFTVKVCRYANELEYRISDSALPARVMAAKQAVQAIKPLNSFDEAEVKRAIREEMGATNQVQSLLANPDFQKSAAEFLKGL